MVKIRHYLGWLGWALILSGTSFASAADYKVSISQFGAVTNIGADDGQTFLTGSPLTKRPFIGKGRRAWMRQGGSEEQGSAGIREKKEGNVLIVARQGEILGPKEAEECSIAYGEECRFYPGGKIDIRYEAEFSAECEWSYPLFVRFNLPKEIAAGRGFLAEFFDDTRKSGVASVTKQTVIRNIRDLKFSTTRGVIVFSVLRGEIWLTLNPNGVEVQICEEDCPLWRTQTINAGETKELSFSLKLPVAEDSRPTLALSEK